MKLLYAEDEPTMAEAVTDILNYHNFMVDAVADGAEALAYARAGDYDGIILRGLRRHHTGHHAAQTERP